MEHVSLRLRAVICVVIATLFYVFSAGQAVALPPQETGQGAISQNPSVQDTWMGTAAGEGGDPALCKETLSLAQCSLRKLEALEQGVVETVIEWPAAAIPADEAILHLFIFRCTGQDLFGPICEELIAQSTLDRGGFQRAVWRVTNTPTDPMICQLSGGGGGVGTLPCALPGLFEIRVTPFSVPLVVQDYTGCSAYDDNPQGLCPVPVVVADPVPEPANQFLNVCGDPSDREVLVTGNGFVRKANDQKEHFSLRVENDPNHDDDDGDGRRDDDDGDGNRKALEGALKWRDDNVKRFRGKPTCMSPNFETKSALIRGIGELREKGTNDQWTTRTVCTEVHVDDNTKPGGTEQGGSDTHRITFFEFGTNAQGEETCNNVPGAGEPHEGPGGTFSRGDIRFREKVRGYKDAD